MWMHRVSVRLVVLSVSTAVFVVPAFAVDPAPRLSAVHTIQLDPRQFRLGSLTPGPDLSGSKVGSGNLSFTIKQWSDGTLTYSADSQVEMVNLATGQTSMVSTALGAVWKAAGKIGIKVFEGSAATDYSSQLTVSTSNVASQTWAKKNAVELVVENNLVSAIITYTREGVQYRTEIPLGIITEKGVFEQFPSGWLAGKSIIANAAGRLQSGVVSVDATPASKNPLLHDFGVVNRAGRIESVWVLTGWWVEVGRVNGQIVSVIIEPEYELRETGFSSFSSGAILMQETIRQRTAR